MSKPRPVGVTDPAARYALWKEEHVPLLYDWLSSRQLMWPHAAVRWGAPVPQLDARGRNTGSCFSTRSLYLAERTGNSETDPNTLLQFDVRVVDEYSSRPHEIATPWSEEATSINLIDNPSTPEFWLKKRIIHPGEVNKIGVLAPNWLVTHTDSPELFIWDMTSQPNRPKEAGITQAPNEPTCTLTGHTANAEYALSVAPPPPAGGGGGGGGGGPTDGAGDVWVASGGSDRRILVWKLGDYQALGARMAPSVRVGDPGVARAGHTKGVEDVSFSRADRGQLASVSTDRALLLWDLRDARRPASAVPLAHDGDVNTVDCAGVDAHLIATGGADDCVKVWDRRRLVGPTGGPTPRHTFRGHRGEVHAVEWNPFVPGMLASGAADGQVIVWNCADAAPPPPPGAAADAAVCPPPTPPPCPLGDSPALLFRHVGHTNRHATVVDLHWQPDQFDPWCIVSLSEVIGDAGGSTLQMWRMTDLVHRPREEVTADLRRFHAANGK